MQDKNWYFGLKEQKLRHGNLKPCILLELSIKTLIDLTLFI